MNELRCICCDKRFYSADELDQHDRAHIDQEVARQIERHATGEAFDPFKPEPWSTPQ